MARKPYNSAAPGKISRSPADFYLNPFTSVVPYSKHRAGVETFLPPALERIHALTGDDLEIVSVPRSPRWLFGLTFWLGLLLLIAFLARLFAALG
jgi:hypothetical protein